MTTIRPAFEEDAQKLAILGAETFEASFGHLYARKDLEAFNAKSHSVEAYQKLLRDPEYGLWIVESDDGAAIGYAVAGPCGLPVPDMPANSGELMRLYLRKDAQGGGLGGRLLETTQEFLRDRFDHVYLSVYSGNSGAQRLYERYGFVKVHDYFYRVGDHLDPEWIMELKEP